MRISFEDLKDPSDGLTRLQLLANTVTDLMRRAADEAYALEVFYKELEDYDGEGDDTVTWEAAQDVIETLHGVMSLDGEADKLETEAALVAARQLYGPTVYQRERGKTQ